jgi:hypothetical protein
METAVGGAAPCGCRRLRRGRRSPRCVIHPVEHAAPAVSLDDGNARSHASRRRNSATPCGSAGNRKSPTVVAHWVTELGRTVWLGLLPRAAAARASVSAPLLPLFLAVPGLHGQFIARAAPASAASPHRSNRAPRGHRQCTPPPRRIARDRAPAGKERTLALSVLVRRVEPLRLAIGIEVMWSLRRHRSRRWGQTAWCRMGGWHSDSAVR